MEALLRPLCVVFVTLPVFAQTDRGSLTGIISDPAGAVVPSASIEAKNSLTDAIFSGGASATGNYTLSVPRGTYALTVTVSGFKQYVRQNLEVPVATTVRWDVKLEVGATIDTITVSETTPLLKTESGDISHNVTADQAASLPVLMIGTTSAFGNIRNPLMITNLLPGVQFSADNILRVNGLPSNSETIRVEGQDATNGIWRQAASMNQQGMEAIQEVAIQTSNYAAEFGQAAGGYFNFTMKSGTNQYRGTAYDYYVNEFLNAGIPYTDAGASNSLQAGQHNRTHQRRNDYGVTFGGPITIPKVYDGHEKSFFFFNWEQFRETQGISNGLQTVPTLAYRSGDFARAIPTCTVPGAACPAVGGPTYLTSGGAKAVDNLGRNILQFGIYDPNSTFTAPDGSLARNLFPSFQLPPARLDKVALNIQNLLPKPNSSNANALINNYNIPFYTTTKVTSNPSVKIDHSLNSTIKISVYLSRQLTFAPNNNGLDPVLTAVAPTDNRSTTVRINYDQSIASTLLLHLGAGYLYTYHPGLPPRFDQKSIGLTGYYNDTFPNFGGLNNATTGGAGSFLGFPIGASAVANQVQWDQKPTANASLTWVKNSHSIKFGGELVVDGVINHTDSRGNGIFNASGNQTQNIWENGKTLNSSSGFGYASFLLGQIDNLTVAPVAQMKLGNHGIGLFAQDTWKVTRRLTLDYGLRYDFQTYLREQYGRMQSADWNPINKKVNLPGTVKYEGYGPGRCNCAFSNNYPWGLGPRLSLAYQLNSKTVLRAGSAISYGTTSNNAQLSLSIEDFYLFNRPGYGLPAVPSLAAGNPYAPGNPYGNPTLSWPNFDPDKYPTRTVCSGTFNTTCYPAQSPFISIDDDSRPPRIFQYSVGVQREVTRSVVVDVSYVGNRGVWFTAPGLNITNYNALQLTDLPRLGLDPARATDRALLTTPLNSPLVAAKGLAKLPYVGFPVTQNLVTALVSRPQWGSTIPPFLGPALGKTWYDSLQVKVTKRYSHGLDMQGSFTYGKELSLGSNSDTAYLTAGATRVNDVFNRDTNKQLSPFSQPFRIVISGTYTTPARGGDGISKKVVSQVLKDWQLGVVFQYQSGAVIQVPNSNNQLFAQLNRGGGLASGASTYYNFASGKTPQDVFLLDANGVGQSWDPTRVLGLNKDAWADAPGGQFATTAAYYNNYRWQRQPSENMNFGRNFRMGKEGKMNLQIRAEFQNVFNRHFYTAPSSTNPATTVANGNAGGALSAGFGFVNTINGAGARPRTGQMVARFTF